MVGAVSHVKTLAQADFTGTITGFDSRASTQTLAATNLVRPSNWNSAHNEFVTISGNTAGQSTVSGTNIVLAGANNITLSAATAADAATISIIQNDPFMSRFTDFGADGVTLSATTGGIASASMRVFSVPNPITFTEVDIPVFVGLSSSSAANTWAVAISSALVIYSNNASTLSPIVGATGQTTLSWASNTANFSSLTGARYLTFPVATSLGEGEYFAAFSFSSATSSVGTATTSAASQFQLSMSLMSGVATASNFTDFGAATAASTNSWFAGRYSNSLTATNQTLAMSDFVVTGTANFRANTPLLFLNY